MNKLQLLVICFILQNIIGNVYAQESISFGPLVAYNIPLENTSLGLKARIPLNTVVGFSPEVRYAPPSFNDFNELSVSGNIHVTIFNDIYKRGTRYLTKDWSPKLYLLGGLSYTRWINYVPSANLKAKKNNFLPEVGGGSQIGTNTFKFFLEGKYNISWGESSVGLGILISPFGKSLFSRSCKYY